jgi:hypothetical protein
MITHIKNKIPEIKQRIINYIAREEPEMYKTLYIAWTVHKIMSQLMKEWNKDVPRKEVNYVGK